MIHLERFGFLYRTRTTACVRPPEESQATTTITHFGDAFSQLSLYLACMLKKILFLVSFVCLFVSYSHAQTAELLDHYTIEDIEDMMAGFGFPSGLIDLNYEVDFYKVTYETLHPNGDMVLVTGALCVPSDVVCPLPLNSYQHGTVAAKTNVPSQQNVESYLGVIYASAGYVSTMPDYIGLGDSPGMHLYVHAESEAGASLDLIRAAEDLQEELGYNLDGQLFLWGYSQGGHATLALQRMIELDFPDEFTITASAPMSGPYDISGVQAEVVTSTEVYPTPGYLPYVVLSYQEVYGNLYEELTDVFLPEYAEIIPGLFDGSVSMGVINANFPDVPSECLLPEVLEAFENDPNHPIRVALEDNDLYDWTPTAPTHLYYCEGDDQVAYENSIVALDAFIANGSTSVQAFNGGPFDHSDCAPFAMLGGFNWFGEMYVPVFAPEIEIDVTAESAEGAEDGAITITVLNEEADWIYEWDNDATGTSLSGLSQGEYTFTIYDENGCVQTWTIAVGGVVGIDALAEEADFILFPQPATSVVSWTNATFQTVDIYDSMGRQLHSAPLNGSTSMSVDFLAKGMYVFVFDQQVQRKLIKH